MSSSMKDKKMIDFLELYDEALHTPSHLLEGVVAMLESIIKTREQAFKMRQQRRREREVDSQKLHKTASDEVQRRTESDNSNDASAYRSKYAALSAKRYESCSDSSDEHSDSEPECDTLTQNTCNETTQSDARESENNSYQTCSFQMVVNKKNKRKCKNIRNIISA